MLRCLLAAILAFAFGAAQAAYRIVEGRVVGVSDDDTITVLDDAKAQHKIRFAGIDAREKAWGCGDLSFALGAREGLDWVRPVLRRPGN